MISGLRKKVELGRLTLGSIVQETRRGIRLASFNLMICSFSYCILGSGEFPFNRRLQVRTLEGSNSVESQRAHSKSCEEFLTGHLV